MTILINHKQSAARRALGVRRQGIAVPREVFERVRMQVIQMIEGRYDTIAWIAKANGVHRSTVFRWIKEGRIPPPGPYVDTLVDDDG